MMLRTKTLLITGATLAALTGVLHVAAGWIFLFNIEQVEREDALRNLNRARDALHGSCTELQSKTGDWACWSDLYEFVGGNGGQFREENLIPASYRQLRISSIIILRNDGQVLYAGHLGNEDKEITPAPAELLQAIADRPALLSGETSSSGTGGIMRTDAGELMLIASHPILTGDREGPARGTLLFGRDLDEAFTSQLERQTHLNLTISGLPPGNQAQPAEPPGTQMVSLADKHVITAHALLKGVSGRPIARLGISLSRDILRHGRRAMAQVTIAILGAGLLCGLLTLALLERLVLSRLGTLMSQVARIGSDPDVSSRVHLAGRDELGQLAETVNGTLAALHHSQERLQTSEAEARLAATRYRQTVDSLTDALHVVDRDLRIQVNNEALRRWCGELGVGAALAGENIFEAFPFLSDRVRREYETVFETGRTLNTEERVELGGRQLVVQVSKIPVRGKQGVEHVITLLRNVTEARKAEDTVRTLSHAVEQSANLVIIAGLDGRIQYVNRKFTEVSGYSSEEAIGHEMCEFRADLHPPEFSDAIRQTVSAGGEWHGEICDRRKDGQCYWTSASISPIRDAEGRIKQILAIKEDITERKHAEETLRMTRFCVDHAADVIMWVDRSGRLGYVNDAACRSLGRSREELLQMAVEDIDPNFSAENWDLHWAEVKARGSITIESCHRTKEGQFRPVEIVVNHVEYDGKEYHCSFARDVSERRRNEDQLRRAAMHDALTGLPNRSLFTEHLTNAICRAKRHPEYKFAVMFLDFDRFKIINDSLGHQIGDQLLVAISQRLQMCLRSGDTVSRPGRCEIARLGGDEFVILLDGIGKTPDAARVAERIQTQLSESFHLSGHEVHTSVSIGIVSSEGNYDHPEDMIRDADTAMYRAKTQGKARHVIFDKHMHDQALFRLRLETELRKAVERNECRVVYQPIVSLESGQLHGFEALVRWQHPERGVVSPADFIPIGEETGLIVPIGKRVLEDACRDLQALGAHCTAGITLSMNVNLSKRQLIEEDLVRQVGEVLERTGTPPSMLKLEVTESAIMEHAEAVTPVLRQLKKLGVKLAMDDFGTGHSSLSCLHRFPIDVLKIDQAFVSNMSLQNVQYAAIVQAIVTLAHNLGMEVVAEGIETVDQLAQLQALNCDFGQGYFFSKAVPPQEAAQFVTRTDWVRRPAWAECSV